MDSAKDIYPKDSFYWKMLQICPKCVSGNELCEECDDYFDPETTLMTSSESGSNDSEEGSDRNYSSDSEKEVDDLEDPEMGVYDCSILYKMLVQELEDPEMEVYDCSILYKRNDDSF